MKRKEIKKKIEEVLKYHAELDAQWGVLEKTLGIDTSVGLANLTWSVFDSYTDCISREIGDEDQWLSWFIFDNRLGYGGLKASAGLGCKMKLVENIDDLVELIKGK